MGSFFYQLRVRLAQWMYGRNGPDQLSRATLIAALVADLLSAVFYRRVPVVASILSWAALALLIWTIFRVLSRNLPKRQAENQAYLMRSWRLKSRIAAGKARRADKEHKYFTCKCGAVCRVPAGKGTIEITCPKCGAKIRAKT